MGDKAQSLSGFKGMRAPWKRCQQSKTNIFLFRMDSDHIELDGEILG